jgi:hypothetical protein
VYGAQVTLNTRDTVANKRWPHTSRSDISKLTESRAFKTRTKGRKNRQIKEDDERDM